MRPETRRCYGCKQTKRLTAFARDWTNTDTVHHRRYLCTTCASLRRDAWRQAQTPAQRRTAYRRERARKRRHREATIATLVAMLDALVAQGWTRTAIAEAAGCKTDTVCHWLNTRGEGARTVYRSTLDKISRVYLAAIDEQKRGQTT